MIDGEVVADPYAKALAAEKCGQKKRDAEPRSPRESSMPGNMTGKGTGP